MEIWCFDDYFPISTLNDIKNEFEKILWSFKGHSDTDDYKTQKNFPVFWYKELINTNSVLKIKNHIEISCDKEIKIDRMYMNGQAHSQSGIWHRDVEEFRENTYTLVYFLNEWPPEYGGHLLIKTENDVVSFLPKQNRAIFFHSNIEHMGLEPSCFCKTQRESLAVKFTIQE